MSDTMNRLDDLTVFVISSGEDTSDECIESLHDQDCSFRIEQISGVCPMSRAFQEMPDRCTTRFFVQVDADMILKKDAIRTLYENACNSSFFSCVVYGQLYEEGFGVGGSIRLWKKSVFKIFSFKDCRTVDRNFYHRSRLLGFKRKNINKVLGIHKPRHSFFSDYLKTKSDIEKWRFLRRPFKMYAGPLFHEMTKDMQGNRYRLLGMLLGSLTLKSRVVRSKNIDLEKECFGKIMALFGYGADNLNGLALRKEDHLKNSKKIFNSVYKHYRQIVNDERLSLSEAVLDCFSFQKYYGGRAERLLEILDF